MTPLDCLIVGLPGPTHYFGGLSQGNKASESSSGHVSFPKAAALQSIELMRLFLSFGHPVIVLPPHIRPYKGVFSSSFMWTANMATVTSSASSSDKKVHITPASLLTFSHRQIETHASEIFLRHVFNDGRHFAMHAPSIYPDEGAANHAEFLGQKHVFVVNGCLERVQAEAQPQSHSQPQQGQPLEPVQSERSFEPVEQHSFEPSQAGKPLVLRQARQAFEDICSHHQLDADHVIFLNQKLTSIRQGVFHNDVCFLSGLDCFFCHESSFQGPEDIFLLTEFLGIPKSHAFVVSSDQLSIDEAVRSYVFNSTLVPMPDGTMTMIAPMRSKTCPKTQQVIHQLLASKHPIQHVVYVDLDQSMKNGGGPACLRLRVPLTSEEKDAIDSSFYVNSKRLDQLASFVQDTYPDSWNNQSAARKHALDVNDKFYDKLGDIIPCGDIYRAWKEHL